MLVFQPQIDALWPKMLALLDTIPHEHSDRFLRPEQYKVASASLGQIMKNATIVILDRPRFIEVSAFPHPLFISLSSPLAKGPVEETLGGLEHTS